MVKQQVQATINNIFLKPYPKKIDLYQNLILKMEYKKNVPLVKIVSVRRSHKIQICLTKMHLNVVNRYFEELLAFKNEISKKFSDLKQKLISKVKIYKNNMAEVNIILKFIIF